MMAILMKMMTKMTQKDKNIMTFQQKCTYFRDMVKMGQQIWAWVNLPTPLLGNARKKTSFFNG